MQLDSLSWFPGHMTKTRRMITAELGNVDAVCEILDARIPMSSRNPDVDELTAGKPRLIVLNRVDQADPEMTKKWAAYFRSLGCAVIETDAKQGGGVKQFSSAVRTLLHDKIASYEAKGQIGRVLRVMVLGIPNVGKSTFINKVSGRKSAKAEDRPGVTRTKQWVPVDKTLELLDTPGILWPKFEDSSVGIRLAFTGAIRDEVIDIEELAMRLMDYLGKNYPKAIEERYKLTVSEEDDGYALLEKAGRKRGFLISGGEVDTERMSRILLDEFRGGKLGRFTLEFPPEGEAHMSVNLHYEDKARSAGFSSVCGVDEAGAGPLMGPVYAAAVILPEGCEIEGLNDSKKMTEKKREALFPVICEKAVAYAIASVDEKEIDATDILSARMKAMQLAIDALQIPADYALIDGNRDHGASAKITTPHETIVGGDGASLSIAAASVLAKVSRDHYVVEVLDPMYPEYQFARHKGYGTKLHYQMLDQYGPSPVHRMTFLKKWEARR